MPLSVSRPIRLIRKWNGNLFCCEQRDERKKEREMKRHDYCLQIHKREEREERERGRERMGSSIVVSHPLLTSDRVSPSLP